MLRDRLRTSAILIAVVLALLSLDYFVRVPGADGVWLLPLLLFFAIGTAWEIAVMSRAGTQPIRLGVAVVGATLVASSAAVPFLWAVGGSVYPQDCPVGRLGWVVLAVAAAIFLSLIAEMRDYGTSAETSAGAAPGQAVRRTSMAVFVSVYVGVPMAMLIALRGLHAETTAGRFGLAALITTILVTKVADAGAYFSGRALGRHKLIPRLSPGKTVEGAIGGILASTVVAYLALAFLFPELLETSASQAGAGAAGGSADVTTATSETVVKTGLSALLAKPWIGALVLGPVLAVCGMLGDLAESLFKRDLGVKDSGNLLPGLGGVWDVTDSLVASSVPAFFCFATGVGGP
ncbi:Phosphatidate cytidylyltransferase [Stieleria maiorica]|uniref:Phosphatidate cytidylyltransferase n=1 Tax=Stieleria maiorica TaxID=2795974 RepID=A0A5B9MEC3_9BACT|nr:phosphatidate cytidylyltransferase [Stieleria maiorica]QEF98576.1 Phosphatidate cytidylyltransferase [Stieleria maiorica]